MERAAGDGMPEGQDAVDGRPEGEVIQAARMIQLALLMGNLSSVEVPKDGIRRMATGPSLVRSVQCDPEDRRGLEMDVPWVHRDPEGDHWC